jgi:hypothetical protein
VGWMERKSLPALLSGELALIRSFLSVQVQIGRAPSSCPIGLGEGFDGQTLSTPSSNRALPLSLFMTAATIGFSTSTVKAFAAPSHPFRGLVTCDSSPVPSHWAIPFAPAQCPSPKKIEVVLSPMVPIT